MKIFCVSQKVRALKPSGAQLNGFIRISLDSLDSALLKVLPTPILEFYPLPQFMSLYVYQLEHI